MTKNNSVVLAVSLLVLAVLACTRVADVTPGPAPLPTLTPKPSPVPTLTPGEYESVGTRVTVLADQVNIRTADGQSQGVYATAGTELVVKFRPDDGFAVILSPAKWNGMKIWRGCTSDPGEFGCEASGQ